MTNEDVIAVVAVTATKTVIEAATAAMATVTMTVGMRIATATREDRALSGMIALLCALRPHRLDLLPLAVQVPHTMTTPGDILPRHRHLPMTDLDGQAHHLRMLPLGTSRKICTEGTFGWMEGVIISNGAGNSVSIVLSVSGRRPLVLPQGICRLNETEKHAKGINVIAPLLFHLQRRIARRNGGVVKEKSASERGRKRIGESGDINVHKVLRMMRSVSVIVIAGRDAVGQGAENVAKLGHQPQAHAAPSQVMKMSGWKSLLPLAPLSPLFPLLCRP
jgi:hypothetical protein